MCVCVPPACQLKDWPLQMESLTELEYLDISYNSIEQVEGGPLGEFVNLAYLGDPPHTLFYMHPVPLSYILSTTTITNALINTTTTTTSNTLYPTITTVFRCCRCCRRESQHHDLIPQPSVPMSHQDVESESQRDNTYARLGLCMYCVIIDIDH